MMPSYLNIHNYRNLLFKLYSEVYLWGKKTKPVLMGVERMELVSLSPRGAGKRKNR
jgi:hypothetical protein